MSAAPPVQQLMSKPSNGPSPFRPNVFESKSTPRCEATLSTDRKLDHRQQGGRGSRDILSEQRCCTNLLRASACAHPRTLCKSYRFCFKTTNNNSHTLGWADARHANAGINKYDTVRQRLKIGFNGPLKSLTVALGVQCHDFSHRDLRIPSRTNGGVQGRQSG